jgi:DNA-binding MarR family transcriptional regulator
MSIPARVLDVMRRIVRLLREGSAHSQARVGLSAAQLFVLQRLDGPAPLSLTELAARTLTHQSSVSTVVAKLVAKKLVRRRHASDDARRVQLELTAAGRSLVARAPSLPQDRILAAIASLPQRDQERLAQALEQLGHALGFAADAPPMLFERAPLHRRRKKS